MRSVRRWLGERFRWSRWRATCSSLHADLGEAVEHGVEVSARDLDDFDVIERGAGGGACGDRSREQAHLAEVAAAGQVGEDHLFAVAHLRDADEADADEVEGVGAASPSVQMTWPGA